jgi:hypothetical protein
MPTSAAFKAGASLMPSPRNPHTWSKTQPRRNREIARNFICR